MTDQYTKLADELDATAGNNSDMYEHERDSCREAARILRAAAGVDVAGLMDVADRYALAQADPAHWRSALESDLRLALAAKEQAQPAGAWMPTAENINALPEPLRDYVHQLEARCDPSGTVRENAQLKDVNKGLQIMYRNAADAAAQPAVQQPAEDAGLLDRHGKIRGDLKASAYCVGNEYKPFHPSASHVRPEWRDGWNACFVAAIKAQGGKQ